MPSALHSDPLLARFGPELCHDPVRPLEIEWIQTDVRGGYASSTLSGFPTRRYHGWLVGRPPGHAKRHVFLARMLETVQVDDGTRAQLTGAEREGDPGGQPPEEFQLAPHPITRYRLGERVLVRELLLLDEGALLCRYTLESGPHTTIELRPLLPFREADALTVENDVLDGTVSLDAEKSGWSVKPYAGLPRLRVTNDPTPFAFEARPEWLHGHVYRVDRARGYEGSEDLFSPGVQRFELAAGESFALAVSLAEEVDEALADPARAWDTALEKKKSRVDAILRKHSGPRARIELGAEDFLYRTEAGRLGIHAGFPWFDEWGRDTFLSLPGLTLARGDTQTCGEVLEGALAYLKDGLLPNIFGLSRDDSHYGSIDASLWFARAVRLFDDAGGDPDLVRDRLLPALEEIGNAYHDGTLLGIQADEAGLISAGSPELNPTWMDARTPAGPVTPRHGCAVEINALWYSLLEYLEGGFESKGDTARVRVWQKRRRDARKGFLDRFWSKAHGYLADVWQPDLVDWSVRPNMVIAAALEASPLNKEQRRLVVLCAEERLVTERGLRTLAPEEEGYQARYAGGPDERDAAYHQGTVWPWLIGFYVEARLRAFGPRRQVVDGLRQLLNGFAPELDRAGLNHISEVFDAEPPRTPGGTIAQAWNTAELLRAWAMLDGGNP